MKYIPNVFLALLFVLVPLVSADGGTEVAAPDEKEVVEVAEEAVEMQAVSSKRLVSEQRTMEAVIKDFDDPDNAPLVKFYFSYRLDPMTGAKTPAMLIITDGDGMAFLRFPINQR